MVMKEGKVIAVGVLMALFLVIGNSAYFIVKSEESVGLMSGNSIKDIVTGFYQTSSVNQRIFILFQFFLLLLIIIVILIIIKKFKSKSKLSRGEFLKKGRVGSRTDIDILYEMLKKYKEVSISEVTRIFKVTPEVSMEWAKVLENGNLATIEYPRFGKPVLRLPAQEEEEEVKKKEIGKKKEEHMEGEKKELQKVVPERVMAKKVVKKVKDRKIAKMDKKIRKMDKKMEKISKKAKKRAKKASAKKTKKG